MRYRVKSSEKLRPKDSLPLKPVLDELGFLRRTFREVVAQYAAAIEAEIVQISTLVKTEGEAKRVPAQRTKDMRDLLMLIRSLDVKPAKGRRRDLKRIESLVEEMRTIVERW